MNDEATIVIVLAGTLATVAFMAAQLNLRKSSRQHSLGEMYRPAPKQKAVPTAVN